MLGGDFPATKDVTWPTCDSTNPPPCTGFLSPPAGSGISIVEELSVIAGGSVYYRCDDHPKMTTNLGMEVRVRCARDGAGGVAFEKPAGWDLLACEPAAYPDFEDTPCRCLGDVGITKAQHSEILDKVCRMDTPRVIYGTQIVPFKSRCGVTSLADIVPENRCYCTEKVDDGVGMMLLCTFVGTANNSHSYTLHIKKDLSFWSVVELKSHLWNKNLSDPLTIEFQAAELELETAVSFKFTPSLGRLLSPE